MTPRTMDGRDATPPPFFPTVGGQVIPADAVDPRSILRNRERVRLYMTYGVWFNFLPEAMQCKS